MHLQSAIPVLRIFDVDKAKAFYLDFLGFELDWEHRFAADLPLYAQVHRDELILHLTEHYGDATPGSAVFVWVKGLRELEQALQAKRFGYARPSAEPAGWGLEMQVRDPFGNLLRFCEDLHEQPVVQA